MFRHIFKKAVLDMIVPTRAAIIPALHLRNQAIVCHIDARSFFRRLDLPGDVGARPLRLTLDKVEITVRNGPHHLLVRDELGDLESNKSFPKTYGEDVVKQPGAAFKIPGPPGRYVADVLECLEGGGCCSD